MFLRMSDMLERRPMPERRGQSATLIQVPSSSIAVRDLWLRILIGTPAHDGVLTIACVSSVLQLMESMRKADPNIGSNGVKCPGRLLIRHVTF